MTVVGLQTPGDVLLQELVVVKVLWVLKALGLHTEAHEHGRPADGEHDHGDEELPSIGGLGVFVVLVSEVTVVEGLGLLSGQVAPVAGGSFLADSVQLWVLVRPLWCLWKWMKIGLLVIRISVGMGEELSVLSHGHQVTWIVDVVLLGSTGSDATEGERP